MTIFNEQAEGSPTNPSIIIVDPSQESRLPEMTASHEERMIPILCESGAHLAELLGTSYSFWEDYKNRVVGLYTDSSESSPPAMPD